MAKQVKKTEKVKETNKSTNQQTSTNTAFNKKSPIQRWIDDYKTTFKQYQEHCRANNWVFSENLEQLYDIEKLFINIALDRAKQFTKKFESYLRYQYVQDFLELLLEPVRLYMERYHLYLRSNMLINIQDPDRKLREMEFQAKLTADYNKFSDRYYDLNINREEQHSELPIHGDKKIPFLMAKTMEDMFPYIKDIKTSLNKVEEATTEDLATHTIYDVMNSTELFRNIKNPPPYDLTKHYYEQSKDTLDFYEEELKKIKQGVTIAGVFIHPLLYWHINYFKTDMPMNMFKGTPFYDPNESILIGHPFLRDNELFFVDSYQRAQEQNLSLFMFGSRRIGKALWVGEKVYKAEGGTKNIGDIKVGDRIIGGDGKPTNVLGVYPQGLKPLYRLLLADGRSVLCCKEHLWTLHKGNQSEFVEETVNTEFILENLDKFEFYLPKSPNGFGVSCENTKIVSVEYERDDEAVCIRVDNEKSLFLTTCGIVTHNTTLEASLLSWRSTIVRNGEGYVVGGSERDLKKLSKTIMIAMNNIHPAFRLQNNRQDWDSHVQLGLKKKDNTVIDYNNLYISNVNSGSKADSLKTAGGSPSVFAVDEIGKFDCKLMYQQALPSFDTPEGRRCPVVLTGTGGEEEMSRDAQDMLLNPASYAILPMDWELLENYVGEERLVTWKRRSFGIFVPGQMSYKSGLKKKVTTLADYKKVESESLKKLELHLTDWTNAKEVMEKDRENKKNDKDALAQEKMSYPFDPMESFVNRIENPFCAKEGQEHLEHLREEGLTGKKVEITRLDGTKRLKTFFSDKELAPFPFKGGNIDAPIVIFEEPPENPKFDFTYVAGLDPYKHDKANTDSIGVLYIFKRAVNIKDPFADRVVAVYAARPDRIDTFNETCEMLLEGYGAQCLMENADISFQIYLRRKGKDGILLANGEELVQSQINPRAVQNNKVGMNTSIVNQRYIFNLTQGYANEWITVGHTEDGDAIEKRGIVRIPDEGLLQEMIGYYPGMNADRLVAFGHALALARYWDSLNLVPRREVPMDKDMFKEQKLLRQQFASPYSSGIISPYSQTFSPYGGF